jgi:hypothetical protein
MRALGTQHIRYICMSDPIRCCLCEDAAVTILIFTDGTEKAFCIHHLPNPAACQGTTHFPEIPWPALDAPVQEPKAGLPVS